MKRSTPRLLAALGLAVLAACGPGIAERTDAPRFMTMRCGRKFVSLGWHGAALWVASRPMREGEQAETVLVDNGHVAFEIRECAVEGR